MGPCTFVSSFLRTVPLRFRSFGLRIGSLYLYPVLGQKVRTFVPRCGFLRYGRTLKVPPRHPCEVRRTTHVADSLKAQLKAELKKTKKNGEEENSSSSGPPKYEEDGTNGAVKTGQQGSRSEEQGEEEGEEPGWCRHSPKVDQSVRYKPYNVDKDGNPMIPNPLINNSQL